MLSKLLLSAALTITCSSRTEQLFAQQSAPESFPLLDGECDLSEASVQKRGPVYEMLLDKFKFSASDDEK